MKPNGRSLGMGTCRYLGQNSFFFGAENMRYNGMHHFFGVATVASFRGEVYGVCCDTAMTFHGVFCFGCFFLTWHASMTSFEFLSVLWEWKLSGVPGSRIPRTRVLDVSITWV